MKIILLCLGIGVVILLVRFAIKGANYGLIARNISNNFLNLNQSREAILPVCFKFYIAAYVNGFLYFRRDENLRRRIYDISQQFEFVQNVDVNTLSRFVSLVMIEYFQLDSSKSLEEIKYAVNKSEPTIRRNVEECLNKHKAGYLRKGLVKEAVHYYNLFYHEYTF